MAMPTLPEHQAPPLSGVTPYINVDGAAAASELYQKAFGAIEYLRIPAEDGKRLIHCHLGINGGTLMVSDLFSEMPEHGAAHAPSVGLALHLQVADVDAVFQRAVDAGMTPTMAPQVMFWGDRYGTLRDPFGVNWSIATTPNAG